MSRPTSEFDAHMMDVALRMAERGLGITAPNPSVGAVIANETTGELIARATTARGGRPHAETIAIDVAGARARGATIYVTLEPCSHVGRTGPCADAIIAAGLKRAVVAIEDPDPRVAGRGLDRLRAAGIDVQRGLGASQARWIARGHIVRVTERRPVVTLKLALDANGDIARGTGRAPVWVSGEESRAHAALLRAQTDAILVGTGTVRDDDPELTCRLPGLSERSPVRVVLSRSLDIAPSAKLLATSARVPLWVITVADADPAQRAALIGAGANVIDAEAVGGKLWLPATMEALVARGITRLLVEGGPHIWRSFADAALADEVVLYTAGALDEPGARDHVARWIGRQTLELTDVLKLGRDTMWRFRRPAMEGR